MNSRGCKSVTKHASPRSRPYKFPSPFPVFFFLASNPTSSSPPINHAHVREREIEEKTELCRCSLKRNMTGEKKRHQGDRGGTSEPRAGQTSTTTVEGSSARRQGREDPRTTSPTGQRQGGGVIFFLDLLVSFSQETKNLRRGCLRGRS